MKTHQVKQGECLLDIADRYGFGDWQRILDDPANQLLKDSRDPNCLLPGDRVQVPDAAPKQEKIQGEALNRFVLQRPPAYVAAELLGADDKPLAGLAYRGKLLDEHENPLGDQFDDTTTPEGRAVVKVPLKARYLRLSFAPDPKRPKWRMTWQLAIAELDPVDTPSGVQGRLNNLLYNVPQSDEWDAATCQALAQFQRDCGLPETGEADAATRARLEQPAQN